MKLNLRSKLAISYVLLAAFLALSLLFVTNHFLEKQFQVYVAHKQDMKNEEILEMVTRLFSDDGSVRNPEFLAFLTDLGDSLMEQGVSLMVYDANGVMVYCAALGDADNCAHTLGSGKISDDETCHDFHGTYTRRNYEITRGGTKLGYVTLGYHGPFYYNEGDRVFLNGFNRVFIGMTVLFFITAAGVGLYMAGRIAWPIIRVTERTKRIAEGEYSERVDIATGTTEIDDLSAGVDHLAESLQTQFMLKKRMAHAYSHEFRTPLAALQSNIEAMIDGLWAPTPERLESLLEEIFRLSRMVSEVEDLVRVQVRNQDDKKRGIQDISEMTERVLRSFETGASQKSISLSHEKSRCEAQVEPDKFSQVIFNLVSNSVKYTDPGGNILVRTFTREDGSAVLSVEDDGIGIGQSDLPHIFDYLYRADESRARDSGGNGIGLSVVKAVVERHGGAIQAESSPGHGATFTVSLPPV
ncbi:MAG: HAMP domain-containing histidine kinase [Synergistaceae bacterium]|jgi:signal transduction histidine kinase|nr:HAMP domain-containing histidine kinase [Synergistaceae bacterium]